MDQVCFENNLQNSLFTEYFNCFLALPIFSRTIQYNLNTKEFEEVNLIRDEQTEKTNEPQDAFQVDSLVPPSVTHSHAPSICGDNYISTLERDKALDWISQERLPAFLKSDLYSEYKLANLLISKEGRCQIPSVTHSKSLNCIAVSDEFEGGVNFQILASKKEMGAFKRSLINTKGENDYLFWIECERLTTYERGDPELSVGFREIKDKYIRPGAKCELAKGRWGQRSQPISLDDIFNLQGKVLNSLVNYWCPRYLMSACSRVMNSSNNSKRSRPTTHQGRSSVLNESQMSALKCDSQASRELASPLILPQLSHTHFPLCSTPNTSSQMPTARSFSVIASINKLPYICENVCLSESISIPKSSSATFPSEMQKRKRSRSVPLPKLITSVKEEKFHQQLTRCLSIEHRKAGGVFQQYIEKVGNQKWRNSLLCWREIQNFKAGFLTEDFNPFQVETRAKIIFSKYVLSSGEMWVCCPHELGESISRSIYPAFEDLFDSLEEHTLQILTEPWEACVSREQEFLEQIRKSDDSASLYQWEKFEDDVLIEELGVVSEIAVETREKSPEPLDSGEEVEHDEDADKTKGGVDLNTPLGYTFQQVIQDNTMLNLFKGFLDSKHASVDIMFWMEVESFRRIPAKEGNLRNAKAKLIRSQYLTKNYYFSVNSPASKEAQRRMVTLGGGKFGQKLPQRPPTPVLVEGQKQVQAKLEHRWLPVFVKTREFLRYAFPDQDFRKLSMQASLPNPEEWKNKVFESRWMTNSRDIINCRKSILNPTTCKTFETFIELKSSKDEHLKNDLNFWLEIERFKELWHVHTPKTVLQLKVEAIINCFLQSKLPPKIQVDLPQDLVEKLMRKVVGPYMFREAQADMFRVIFSYWMEYQTFKDQHKGEDIDVAFMELRQQVHERELVRLRKQKEFEQKKMAQLRPFGIGQLPGEEDNVPDLTFRLSDIEGGSSGISMRKKAPDPTQSELFMKMMTVQ